ncbi:beta-ketoacyl synthase domain-containing protein [Fusarium austroafricanum]|uniref:Beta-ketoacyl synthase domain-containing protein n=1 Tax=Fusarium austroafricanum TaxID=2364996 RepID=A0A8H4K767_9HYPO|nr:beta-ketoacyl synthase domain-containing protein [Fusarium austroafricanum]
MVKPENRIAIIGMACRLPGGADSPESLWSLLAEGRDGRREVPKDRWDWKSFYNKNPDTRDATNFSHAYFLDQDVSAFDARFFNIPGTDAASMDPQQRLLLEVTYEALENAGLPMENMRGSDTSVHMAMFARDYDRMGYRDLSQVSMSHIIGAGEAILANRISYVLDLKGSSNTLDTGCSGGLVALHQACQTLRADESTIALAGASQLLLTPDQSLVMSQLTNKDGRSYTFDDRGAGYARGEGVGVLVLKRLDRAVRDGDYIHAVLLESGVGHDGKTSGIFLPNSSAQEALARSVYSRAGLDPLDTLFVESHGTGTVAGDNAEVRSISRVFGREAGRTTATDLPVGSIKTNIGHLEAASGVASAIKAIMVLKKNQIPPQLNFVNSKPGLDLEKRGLKVPLEVMPLTPDGHVGPRRVSVNSFGYGGTNAHAILEGYDTKKPSIANDNNAESKPIVLSASSESSLKKLIVNTREWLRSEKAQSIYFSDLAYTLNLRRSKLLWRCSAVASNTTELEAALGDAKLLPTKSSRDITLAFIFTGQGAQWFAMGRELLSSSQSTEFASSIASCNEVMKALGCEWDLIEELCRDEESTRLGEARFAQPATTAVQMALVDLLANTYGIRPKAVCGHSSGEIAAAYAAGALTKEAAMQVSYMRGICSSKAKTMNSTTGGMMAVGEGSEAISQRIENIDGSFGKITVACVNSPESTTISGDVAALDELQAALVQASVFNRRIKVDSAYHSHHMEAVAPSYLYSLDGLVTGKPREDVAFFSSVTAAHKTSGFGADYWVSNLVSQVKFSTASQLVAQHLSDTHPSAANMLIEIGPHAALSGPLRQSLSESNFKLSSGASFKYTYAPCLVRNTSALKSVLALAGKMFESGCSVQFHDATSTNRVVADLPSYPWDHSNTYWRESRLSKQNRLRRFPPHDLLGLFEVASSPYEPRWRYHVSLANTPWLRDHVIEGFMIFPGAGYLIMAIEAMKQLFQLRDMPGRVTNINFQNVVIANPVIIYDDDSSKESQVVELQLIISPSRQHTWSPWEHFRIISYDSQDDSWVDNCSGLVSWDSASIDTNTTSVSRPDELTGSQEEDGLGHLSKAAAQKWLQDIQAACLTRLDAAAVYLELKESGNEYGETFQGMRQIHVGSGFALAKVVIPDITHYAPGHVMQPHTIHPSTLDTLFQLEPVCFRQEGILAPIMPTNLGHISVAVDMDSAIGTEIVVALQHYQQTPRDSSFDFYAYQKMSDGTLRPVVSCKDAQSKAVGEGDADDDANSKMTYRMDWKPDIDFMVQDDFASLPLPGIEDRDTDTDHEYENHLSKSQRKLATAYMQAVIHKSPNIDVLVIGSGPGGASVPLMEAVKSTNRFPLATYTYTDVSQELVVEARSRFGEWVAPVDFKTLDISQEPIGQGLPAHGFDLIVASQISFAPTGRDVAFGHIKKLLRPGGRIIMLEMTAACGGHEGRPVMDLSRWHGYLMDRGFSGLDFVFPSTKDTSSDVTTLMMARLLPSPSPSPSTIEISGGPSQSIKNSTTKLLLGNSNDDNQVALGQALSRSLTIKGVQCSVESLERASDLNLSHVAIVVDSAEYPLLLDPSSETFQHTKNLLLHGGNVLWLSFQSSQLSDGRSALKKMVSGMARVLRRENPSLNLVTIDIQDPIQPCDGPGSLQRLMQVVTEVIMLSFLTTGEIASMEHEYAIQDGKLLIPRVVPDDGLSSYIDSRINTQHSMNSDTSLVPCLYLDQHRPIKFGVRVPGLLKTIRFIDNDEMLNPLGPDEVQVEARAYGVNFKDVLITLGQMPPATQMTGEIAGVITAVGSNVKSWKMGDRVTALFVTPFSNQVRVNSNNIVAIPDSMDFTDAASIPLVFVTAWYCLNQVARLERGQSILIHAGSGGVGQAAIQLAQLVGAHVFTTVGSMAKRKLIQERYGLDDSHVFSSRSGIFKKHILDATQSQGVDVVLNSLSGRLLRDSWDSLAPFGTFCEIGKADILSHSQLDMANFNKQTTFAAIDIFYMHQKHPERVVRGIKEVLSMAEQGLLKPVYPITTFDMSDIDQAISLMAERKHMGKLVLLADNNTLVQGTRPKPPVLSLQKEGTYVICGGLGDIGKRIGQFLTERGAGHIVALTRRDAESVLKQPAIIGFSQFISKLGGSLHIMHCDIGQESSARNTASCLTELGLPPVRGIIQSATVLRDHPFENMEVDDWNESVKPKVQGTLNLNAFFCTPDTTEFFTMLSSVASVVGSASQSNYAAGNAFLEAFAHEQMQTSRGITNYATVNIGAVEGSGLIVGVQEQGIDITNTIGSVSFDEVLSALEYAMNPQAPVHQTVVQHLMHFSRDKIEASSGPWALSDPMYDHIPSKMRQESRSAGKGGAGKKQTILQAVEEAETMAEAESVVKQALLDKFEAFIGDDVPDIPIAALGLDSLVSIELKNWVRHTFKTPLQVSELSNAPSMLALARLIISRMVLKFNQATAVNSDTIEHQPDSLAHSSTIPSSGTSDAIQSDDSTDKTISESEPDWHCQECCNAYKELPVMPLPDLDETLDYWLNSTEHLFSPIQLEHIHHDIHAMRRPNSPARKALQNLYEKHGDDKTNGWFTDILTKARFLYRRAPVAPWTSIMVSQRDNPGKRHSQVERAALITFATVSFKRAIDAGKVKPMEIAGKPECTWGWGWMFNSTRVPQSKCDRVVSYASSLGAPSGINHVAVLRKGHVFKVNLLDDTGNDVSLDHLQATFEAILAHVQGENLLSTLLTTDERDSWAKIRENLLELNSQNSEYFSVLDSAMFVLCLDSGSPETPDEIARHGYIGDGTNRWFDKLVQFYVSANGRSGMITEHSTLDGTTATRLLEWISDTMDAYHSLENSHHTESLLNGKVILEEFVLHMTPDLEKHTITLREKYHEATSKSTYAREQLDEFGTDFLLRSRVPVKGVIDVTFQLAVRLFFGRNMLSWEPTAGTIFHAGRPDAMQRATPAVNTFCDAAALLDHDVDITELRALLMEATKSINASMKQQLLGRGSQRLFEVLSYLWPADEPKPPFLSDMVFFGRPSAPIFSQTNSLEGKMTVENFVHLMPDADGFWSFINPEKNFISVSLTGGSQGRTAAFIKELHHAASIIRRVVSAS